MYRQTHQRIESTSGKKMERKSPLGVFKINLPSAVFLSINRENTIQAGQ